MAARTHQGVSPFLDPGRGTKAGSLAIVHLSRDNLLPIYLQEPNAQHDGYAEGSVVNTRYGSFPHSTMIDVPWGSQVRASKVDTGSRGRKRRRPADDDAGPESRTDGDTDAATPQPRDIKRAVAADSGFVHVLPPTPELWTASLPHRTQVVYTPDYSYILHRIRARPGTRLIEAGSGSGSFTHAAARAVYSGLPAAGGDRRGRVFSFEFHETRCEKMRKEIADHDLGGVVRLTHRDVYSGGFLVDGESPEADAVFLDLPAPWETLPHLSRRRPSPLNPRRSVHICTFSPCIEQVTRTASALRRLGWVDIDMVEVCNRKLLVYRERIGLNIPLERGANNAPADVAEAVARLGEIEDRFREQQAREQQARPRPGSGMGMDLDAGEPAAEEEDQGAGDQQQKQQQQQQPSAGSPSGYKAFMEGRLITRGEAEVKTHTSYLLFAVLPCEWGEEDEARALEKWPCGGEQRVVGSTDKETRRREKREMHEKRRSAKEPEVRGEAAVEAGP